MKKKDLRMIKSFHVTPQADADFEQLRLARCKYLGHRIGKSDFFCWLVSELTKEFEIREVITHDNNKEQINNH